MHVKLAIFPGVDMLQIKFSISLLRICLHLADLLLKLFQLLHFILMGLQKSICLLQKQFHLCVWIWFFSCRNLCHKFSACECSLRKNFTCWICYRKFLPIVLIWSRFAAAYFSADYAKREKKMVLKSVVADFAAHLQVIWGKIQNNILLVDFIVDFDFPIEVNS